MTNRRSLPILAVVASILGCGGSTAPDGGSTSDASDASDSSPIDVAADSSSPDSPDAPAIDSSGADASLDGVSDSASDVASACFGDAGEVSSGPFKLCKADSDCTIETHVTDCCGNSQRLGVAKSDESAYLACEKAWDDHFPGCGCAGGLPKAEDGKTITDPGSVIVKCVDFTSSGGICRTSVP